MLRLLKKNEENLKTIDNPNFSMEAINDEKKHWVGYFLIDDGKIEFEMLIPDLFPFKPPKFIFVEAIDRLIFLNHAELFDMVNDGWAPIMAKFELLLVSMHTCLNSIDREAFKEEWKESLD